MSVAPVSDRHIRFLMAAWDKYARRGACVFHDERESMARVLKAMPALAYDHRYSDNASACPSCGLNTCDPAWFYSSGDIRYVQVKPCPFAEVEDRKPERFDLSPVNVIKQCDYYSYQASESPTWENSFAQQLTRSIRESAISALDGFGECAWGIS